MARGHSLRMENRSQGKWNEACDHVINLGLKGESYSFAGAGTPCMDDKYLGMSEEQVYEMLPDNPNLPDELLDLIPTPKDQIHEAITRLSNALQAARVSGAPAGDGTNDIELLINKFRNPKIRWQDHLHRFLTQLGDYHYSFATPNRRYQDLYLPGKTQDEGRLAKLMYFIDMSYSTSDDEVEQFMSEIKAVWEQYRPEEMYILCFDTKITAEILIDDSFDFSSIKLTGRGGTHLECVRQKIIQHRPTAAIVFSDMECSPMDPLPFPVPVIWAVVRNPDIEVPFGTKLFIEGT